MLVDDLEDLLGDVFAEPDPPPGTPEGFDPAVLLLGMDKSPAAAARCMDEFLRYVNGEPLIRKHRRLDDGWSFYCPDPYCIVWRAGFETARDCRAGWFEHCDKRPHGFTPSWPADIPFEQVYQLVTTPRTGRVSDVANELVQKRLYVDLAGQPMQYENCPCMAIVDDWEASFGLVGHRSLRGTTCPVMVACPKCGRGPGYDCDHNVGSRDFRGGPAVHADRLQAAHEDEQRRRDAGDLRLPAPWLPEIAPTARKPRNRPKRTALLKVRVAKGANELVDAFIREMAIVGRLHWDDVFTQQSFTVMYPSVKVARWMGNLMSGFYGVNASDLEVEELRDTELFRDSRTRARLVSATAAKLRSEVTTATPEEHFAWAAGVGASNVGCGQLLGDLKSADFVREHWGGSLDHGRWEENTRKGLMVRWSEFDGDKVLPEVRRVVPWSKVVKLIKGKVPFWLEREMRQAMAEVGRFPLWSQERDRASGWCRDLVVQAWDLVRPEGIQLAEENEA